MRFRQVRLVAGGKEGKKASRSRDQAETLFPGAREPLGKAEPPRAGFDLVGERHPKVAHMGCLLPLQRRFSAGDEPPGSGTVLVGLVLGGAVLRRSRSRTSSGTG